MEKELLVFYKSGKEKIVEQAKEKYIEYEIKEYYVINNNYMLRAYNITKTPTIIVLENGIEINRI